MSPEKKVMVAIPVSYSKPPASSRISSTSFVSGDSIALSMGEDHKGRGEGETGCGGGVVRGFDRGVELFCRQPETHNGKKTDQP